MVLPKVSIMIPTYNQQKYIIRAIESALLQDYENIEIVISDDNSLDESQLIIIDYLFKKNDHRIRYYRNKENIGILRNYKKTLYEYALGDWVINLDGDDFFVDPGFISAAINLTLEEENIVLVFGNYCEFYQNSSKIVNILNFEMPRVLESNDFLLRYSNDKIYWNHNSIIYKRVNALLVGFYWDEYIPRNDWESFLRLIVNNRVGYINNIAAAWTQHESNETRRIDIKKYLNNYALIKIVSEFAVAGGMGDEEAKKFKSNMLYKSTRGSCIGYIRNRDFIGASVFLTYAYKESRILPFKVILNPGVLFRAVLSISPTLYTKAKSIARKLAFRRK
jgi:glycosyltransferase involved in cell wall biosynthesis